MMLMSRLTKLITNLILDRTTIWVDIYLSYV